VIGGDTLRGWLAVAMVRTGKSAAADDVHRFLDIIKRRSGLMSERGDNLFAFTHLSFQEYFAAGYLAGWVTSAEWLMGEEVPFGTAAANLQQYAADPTWQETLVFLFELLAGAKTLGKKKIREARVRPRLVSCHGGREREFAYNSNLAGPADVRPAHHVGL
jgi:predicted NACHT family NTPase